MKPGSDVHYDDSLTTCLEFQQKPDSSIEHAHFENPAMQSHWTKYEILQYTLNPQTHLELARKNRHHNGNIIDLKICNPGLSPF